MKKTITILFLLIASLILVACNDSDVTGVVISKMYTSSRQANNLIELYNNSDEQLDLSKYSLRFYTNGSTTVSQEIKLSGIIDANSYYAIGSENHSSTEIIGKLDFKYNASLPFNGNDVVAFGKGSKTFDIVGNIGTDFDFSRNLTLIRLGEKENYKASDSYDQYNFIAYLPDVYQYLKNDDYEIKTLEQLYEGPRLEQRYKDIPYVDPDNSALGNGGAVEVKLTSIADGDTAYFTAASDFPGGSVRYFYINTPEINGTNVNHEPWGYVASKYNKEYLLNDASSKTIHIQSLKGNSLNEGYGRNLGLVWINGELSQFLIASEGLTETVSVTYSETDLAMYYKDIPYLTYLRFAEARAIANGWGVHGYPSNPEGEKSPDWNYQANNGTGATATTTPQWTPHLPLNW